MLCTSGFMDDVIFAHNGPYGDIRIDTAAAGDVTASLCAGVAAASYWLRRVLDDDGAISCLRCRQPGAEPAMHHCPATLDS